MAEHLSFVVKKGTIALGAMLMACMYAKAMAQSGQLVDPTRPPTALGAPVDATNGEPPVPAGPNLQSILVAPTRVEAIINGKTVKVGDMVGEAKVIKISDNEVVLRNGKEKQVLKLFENVEKNMSAKRGGLRVESQRP